MIFICSTTYANCINSLMYNDHIAQFLITSEEYNPFRNSYTKDYFYNVWEWPKTLSKRLREGKHMRNEKPSHKSNLDVDEFFLD